MVDIEKINLEEDIDYTLACGITIKICHIKVRDWLNVESCLDILKIYKNEIDDPEIVMMSYLEYLKRVCESSQDISNIFETLIAITIPEAIGMSGKWEKNKGKTVYAICDAKINKETKEAEYYIKWYITAKDFDDIRKIILHQNFYDYDDTYIKPAIRKAIAKQREIESKGYSSPTLEKQKIYVMGQTGFNRETLNNMTYREFSQLYKMKVNEAIYFARNIIKSGYSCTIEGQIIHPLFEKEKGVLDDILIDVDSFKDKVKQVNG